MARRFVQPISSALLLFVMALLWVLFAPAEFGGQSSYVMVAGASMEPTLSMGDLVLIKRSPTYDVGDIATYQHPFAGPIIHRIIERDGDSYIFQGDNNTWIDSFEPTANEIMGELWLHLPGKGDLIRKLQSPENLVSLAIFTVLGLFGTFRRGGKKDKSTQRRSRNSKSAPTPPRFHGGIEGVLFFLAAGGIASGVLAIAAFTKPTTIEKTDPLEYEVRGQFAYSAPAPPGIYNLDFVSTGDPIYFKLTDSLDVSFEFSFDGEKLTDLQGSVLLEYELSDPGGWHRSFELYPMTTFTGTTQIVSGTINFDQVRSYLDELEERTGFARSYYTLSIIPRVIAKVTINGDEALDVFDPRFDFRLEDLQMYPFSSAANSNNHEQISPSSSNFIEQTYNTANSLSILGFEISVLTSRWISGIGGLITLVGFLLVGVLYLRAALGGEDERIGARYGTMLVDIQKSNLINGFHRVEVAGFEDLARFAERAGGVILHEVKRSHHHYFVQEGNVTYHYKTAATKAGSSSTGAARARTSGTTKGKDLLATSTSRVTDESQKAEQPRQSPESGASVDPKNRIEHALTWIQSIDLAGWWRGLVRRIRDRLEMISHKGRGKSNGD